jgi:hypothetical protein
MNTTPNAADKPVRRPRPVLDEAIWRRFERALARKEMFRYHAERRISRNLKPQMLLRDDSVKGGWRPEIKVVG